jgi:glycosyltransferase involved in cell wall biosynthesis
LTKMPSGRKDLADAPLRIAHVQPIALDIFGHRDDDWGTKVRYFLPNMAAAQAGQGDLPTVHLLTSGRARRMKVGAIDVQFHRCLQLPRSLPVTARFGRQLSLSLVRSIQCESTDIVHFHGACSLHMMYGAVAWQARRERIPLVSQDHGPREGKWLETLCRSYALTNTRRVLAANTASREALKALGIPDESIHIVPNGMDPEVFFPATTHIRSPRDAFRVLVVSRLWEDKDPFTMADGVRQFARRGHQVELTVIGQGLLRREVEQRLQAPSLTVRFIEHIDHTELPDYYRSADVFVLTSLREGFNQATIEAMACGLPVVATNIPGIVDGVGDAGILLPTGRADLLADALEHLARNPEALMRCRELGLNRSQRFTWDAVASQLRVIYGSCLERSTHR